MNLLGKIAAALMLTSGVVIVTTVASPILAQESTVRTPAPRLEPADTRTRATAILAGGCFWGVEGVFSHVRGVISVESGYHGGSAADATYERIGYGTTGHAEAVRITYDPRVVSYGTLLRVFFSVVTDPTTLNRQGRDRGTQYRSAIVPTTANQTAVARAYLAQLTTARVWRSPIVTRIEAHRTFYAAEAYHQNFMAAHPDHGYIRAWDAPKLAAFRTMYPALYNRTAAP